MLATDFTRTDCQVGKKRRTYETLLREWRCSQCGGHITTQWSEEGWRAVCARCGGRDFIHQAQAERNRQLVREMFKHLPEEIVQSYMERRTE
jgi:DNA-directed RNA polymerase subunit RPC12/RpoP